MSDKFVTINVGGTNFETTVSTLRKSQYLDRIISNEWNADNKPIKIDRSAVLFGHVLSFLRNPDYPYPRKHVGELDFYAVPHNIPPLEVQEEQKNLKNHKIEVMWNYIKKHTNICKIGDCGNVPYPYPNIVLIASSLN